ncbi:hypothetical protein EDB85DRAFT_1893699 [Lactarius pseudohatsudake]|nr:hypothetical protein EDB85DRAFT_1893699 [Lactarius pseudohatsudake]
MVILVKRDGCEGEGGGVAAVAWCVESGQRRVGLRRRWRCWHGWHGAWSRCGGGVDGGAAGRVDAAVALLAWVVCTSRSLLWWHCWHGWFMCMRSDTEVWPRGKKGIPNGWYLVAVVVAVEVAVVEGDGIVQISAFPLSQQPSLLARPAQSVTQPVSPDPCCYDKVVVVDLRAHRLIVKSWTQCQQWRGLRIEMGAGEWGGLEEVEEGAESRGRLKFEEVAPPGQVAYFPTPQIKLQPRSCPGLKHHFLFKSI